MTMSWKDHTPRRPNRYNDWDVLNRPAADQTDYWCPASLHVRPDASPNSSPGTSPPPVNANLDRLRQLAIAGDVLKMSADELQRLEAAVAGAAPEGRSLNFHVYIRESAAYDQDGFAYSDVYTIDFVGPPIPRLKFRTTLDASRPTALPPTQSTSGVAVGIIDISIAFAHERFRTSAGKTRVAAIWLQEAATAASDNGVAFGARLDAAEIDRLITESPGDESQIYRQTGQCDFSNYQSTPLAYRLSHGTHVLDLAAGADGIDDTPVIFAVQLPRALTGETSGIAMSSHILQAFRQILLWADQVSSSLPLVINFSLGNFAGPKDGYGLVEREIARLIEERNRTGGPTVAVLPAGNSYLGRTTAHMKLQPAGHAGASTYVDWMLRPDDHTPSFVEIWLPEGTAMTDNACPVTVTVTPPGGAPASPGTMPNAGRAKVLEGGGKPIAAIFYDLAPREGGPARPNLLLACNPTATFEDDLGTAPAGPWRIAVANRTGAELDVRLYVERDDTPYAHYPRGRQSIFNHPAALTRHPETGSHDALGPGPVTHLGSLSGISGADGAILVGAALPGNDALAPAPYTSSGPTETKAGPDFSVEADRSKISRGIYAAGTLSGTTLRLSGTSVAAPQATRLIAELFAAEAAAGTGPQAPVDIAALLRKLGARPDATPVEDRQRLGAFAFRRGTKQFESLPLRGYPQIAKGTPEA